MKPTCRRTALSLTIGAILAEFALAGAAVAQTGLSGIPSTPHPAGSSATVPAAGSVTIDPRTGVVTNADGTTSTLAPGTTVIVLPSAGSSSGIGAGNLVSGVVVPAGSAQVAALLTTFAGSSTNLASLDAGLRNRSAITLTSAAGNATFVPPIGPLTAGDVTQALLIASSQLSVLGITQPTPQQIQASLTGGNVTNAAGQSVPIAGVLQQRNRGLTFPQIAQSITGTATPAPAQAGGTSGRVTSPADAAANAAARAPGARADAFASGTTTSSTATGGATAPGTTSSFSSSGNAGTQGGSSTFSSSGTTQAGTGPRGNPAATGGGGLR